MTSEAASGDSRIRVLVVDDHAVVRSGLAQLLDDGDDPDGHQDQPPQVTWRRPPLLGLLAHRLSRLFIF